MGVKYEISYKKMYKYVNFAIANRYEGTIIHIRNNRISFHGWDDGNVRERPRRYPIAALLSDAQCRSGLCCSVCGLVGSSGISGRATDIRF